ncbi:hypothetical protein GCM10023080_067920 [Streptomyces pseudoechinosporeus]
MNRARIWPHRAALFTATVIAAGVLPLASAGTAAAQPSNSVLNTGTVPIGALRSLTGPHQHGTYDDLIPAGMYSGYPFTAGVWIGEGYCVRYRYVDPDGSTSNPYIRQGPRTVPLDSGVRYEMRALPKSNSLCDHP